MAVKAFLFQNIKLCYGFGPPVRPAWRESPDCCLEEEPPGVEPPGEGAVLPLPEEEAPGPLLEEELLPPTTGVEEPLLLLPEEPLYTLFVLTFVLQAPLLAN